MERKRPGRGRPRPRLLAAQSSGSRGRGPAPFMNWRCAEVTCSILFSHVLDGSLWYQYMGQEEFNADPQHLRAEAEKEPRRRSLGDYGDTIRLLKEEKGFSFREIAGWFHQRGVSIDHNAAWRAYSKTTPNSPGGGVTEQNERIEHRTPREGAMPWLKESQPLHLQRLSR
jgi:hypothetical protein